jgi:transketolase
MNRRKIAEKIIRTAFLNKEGHIASALSILDVVLFLYTTHMNKNDRFVLSKGHGSLALYAALLETGKITEEDFFSFCKEDSKLGGHPSSKKISQVEISTGSLGHGLPFSVGIAFAKKIKKEPGYIYCLIGDGEANEGTTWESALMASTYKLDNLICIMDFNKSGERAIQLNTCEEKFKSFGWSSLSVKNGNDESEILKAFSEFPYFSHGSPTFVQLNTIKGKGCPIMENNPEWHHKHPASESEFNQLIESLY